MIQAFRTSTQVQQSRDFTDILGLACSRRCGFCAPRQNLNRPLPGACIFGLAASQHKRYRPRELSSIFISTMRPPPRAESNCKETTMLLSLIRMIQTFREYQRNVAELSALSDRELADIGLDRSDIPRVAAGNYNG